MEDWTPVERVQKNDAGEMRALVNGAWIPVEKAQKNDAGEYRAVVNKAAAIPGYTKPQPAKEESYGLIDGLAPIEVGRTLVTGALGGIVGNIAGAGRRIYDGITTNQTPEQSMAEGAKTAARVSDAITYKPQGKAAQDFLSSIGSLINNTGIAGIGPAEGLTLATTAKPALSAAGDAANVAARNTKNFVSELTPQKPMVGMGSAMTADDTLRMERARSLPIPIDLTKGQATREFGQQQFEREAAKNASIGEPLRNRFADQNEKILQNFDAWVDQTGAESGSLRSTGQIVSNAIAEKAKRAKGEINFAYDKARQNGEMASPVNTKPLNDFISAHEPESINAPVLSSVKAKLDMISKNGTATVNDLEELRKMSNTLGGKDATNAHYSKQVNAIIDQMTENAGGDLYKRARALRARYAKEFEDVGVIDKMMRTKPNSSDRAVAYEDIFNHSILGGSLDDVRAVRKTLQTSGKQGEQAWRELQGETLKHIKDEITKNVATDTRGNKIVSAAKLDKLVSDLDRDGKLDFIFGKQGAQQIRDVNAIAKDVFTSPPGSVNTSNTASILIGLLDTAVSGTAGVPLPIGSAINYGAKKLKEIPMKRRVEQSLNP